MTCEKSDVGLDAALADVVLPDGCFGSGMTAICPNTPLAGDVVIANQTALDTTASPACIPYHLPSGVPDSAYCVIGASKITVATTGRWLVGGSRPLVLLATQITIDGLIDVASHRNGQTGPDANPAACIAGSVPGNDVGGPGGSFGTAGGSGGASEDAPRALAGAAVPKPLALRGGCNGTAGNGNTGGGGGLGGGAVHLIAAQLTIGGTINASGEAGDGAGLSAGGGGGGSGGMIVLEGAQIVVGAAARIFANGGGGGEGGGGSNGGDDGVDSTAPATIGLGGAGNASAGGDGGDGAAGTTPAVTGGDGSDSGGGGGGGAGVIRVIPSQTLGGSISPPPAS